MNRMSGFCAAVTAATLSLGAPGATLEYHGYQQCVAVRDHLLRNHSALVDRKQYCWMNDIKCPGISDAVGAAWNEYRRVSDDCSRIQGIEQQEARRDQAEQQQEARRQQAERDRLNQQMRSADDARRAAAQVEQDRLRFWAEQRKAQEARRAPIVIPNTASPNSSWANIITDLITGKDSHDDDPPDDTPSVNKVYNTTNKLKEELQDKGPGSDNPVSHAVQDRALILLRRQQEDIERSLNGATSEAQAVQSPNAGPAPFKPATELPVNSNPWNPHDRSVAAAAMPESKRAAVPLEETAANGAASVRNVPAVADLSTVTSPWPSGSTSDAPTADLSCRDRKSFAYRWKQRDGNRVCYSNVGVGKSPKICCTD